MQHIALVLDDRILSVPFIDYHVAPQGIDGTHGGRVSGDMTARDAELLAAILSTGPLN
jgi:SecD/SecF fusion protein